MKITTDKEQDLKLTSKEIFFINDLRQDIKKLNNDLYAVYLDYKLRRLDRKIEISRLELNEKLETLRKDICERTDKLKSTINLLNKKINSFKKKIKFYKVLTYILLSTTLLSLAGLLYVIIT